MADSASCSASASTIHAIAEQKYQLTRKLDSVEVRKQFLKRQGKSIARLENQSWVLKDSIETLRKKLVETVESSGVNPSGTPNIFAGITDIWNTVKPAGTFEWVIVIISSIASICIIILVWGIVHWVRGRKKRKKKHAASAQNWPQSAIPKKTSSHPVEPAYPFAKPPETPKSEEHEPQTLSKDHSPAASHKRQTHTLIRDQEIKSADHRHNTSDSSGNADMEEWESVEALRRRMADDIRSIQRFNDVAQPQKHTEKNENESERLFRGATQNSKSTSGDLRERVLRAANQGLNKHEISRRELISVDQVELILRITSQNSKNRLS